MGEQLEMNVDVAVGWLNYAGVTRLKSYHLDPQGSVTAHLKACRWVREASLAISPNHPLQVEMGECHTAGGCFVGRFLVVKLNETWASKGYLVAISINTPGGDRKAASAFLFRETQVRGLMEDLGRAMVLDSHVRRSSIRAAASKWSGFNPSGSANPFAPEESRLRRLVFFIAGLVHRSTKGLFRSC